MLMQGLAGAAGNLRAQPSQADSMLYEPPAPDLIAPYLETLHAYIRLNWHTRDPVHLAAFGFWRTCWIRPFLDGNGRVGRALGDLVLMARSRSSAPAFSVLDLYASDQAACIEDLRAVDESYARTQDVDAALKPIETKLTAILRRGRWT